MGYLLLGGECETDAERVRQRSDGFA
ncbi:hypothetical protein B4U79_06047 [Dinothrombium tinctorium]|uniref:Uncharacterized protein n=1 Tax=Dinothrombium tinctorium TaxID=1965070 RepID=A0A3S3PR67_9ACAR|nr:hypothetical protein B4U79_02396 [Dinothrombium tinctorium]RWS17625.1 hypothetical protein B4U79_06047 [Dinothrombium tinctorium]